MAHGLIATATFEDLADHLAKLMIDADAIAPSGLPMFGLLSADDNADTTAAGLEDELRKADQAVAAAAWRTTLFTPLINAITRHLGAAAVTSTAKTVYASIDAFLTGVGIRVHTKFADLVYYASGNQTRLSKANVYDAAGIVLGTINWSGSGTGALTDGTTTDEVYTGGNSLQWRIPTGKSVTSSSVDLVLKKPDGTNETKTVTIVGTAGDSGAIGSLGTDIYTDLVSITVNSGGANGNQAIIESVCDRAPALIS